MITLRELPAVFILESGAILCFAVLGVLVLTIYTVTMDRLSARGDENQP